MEQHWVAASTGWSPWKHAVRGRNVKPYPQPRAECGSAPQLEGLGLQCRIPKGKCELVYKHFLPGGLQTSGVSEGGGQVPWGRGADGEAAEAPGRSSRPRSPRGESSYIAADVGYAELSPKQLLSRGWAPWAVPGLAQGGGHQAGRQWGPVRLRRQWACPSDTWCPSDPGHEVNQRFFSDSWGVRSHSLPVR